MKDDKLTNKSRTPLLRMKDICRKVLPILMYSKIGVVVMAILFATLIVTFNLGKVLFYASVTLIVAYIIGSLAYEKYKDKVFIKAMKPLTTGTEDFLQGGWARVIRKGSEITYKAYMKENFWYSLPMVDVMAFYPLPTSDEADTFRKIESLMEKWAKSHNGDMKKCRCELNDNKLYFTISLSLPLSSFKRLATDVHTRLISIISTFKLDATRTTRWVKGTRHGKLSSWYCAEFKGFFYSRGVYDGKKMQPCDEEVYELESLLYVTPDDNPEQITEEEFNKIICLA